jgi:UDP:flavonoid glycosyltransferase YjiC (YdhE family)
VKGLDRAMRFVLASWGSRGDIEPFVVVGRELERRGHDVRLTVPPDQVEFAEAAGFSVVAGGLGTLEWLDVHTDFWTCLLRTPWRFRELVGLWREVGELVGQCWKQMSTPLMALADGADLLVTNVGFEQPAINVAEYHDIPLATVHYRPIRVNGQMVPILPSPLARLAMTVDERMAWRMAKKIDDAQRRELGLAKSAGPPSRRIAEHGWLEIQAYDEICVPGLAAEWAQFDGRRPFVGALTVESPTDADDEVASWIAAGSPPIYFGFGSMPVESAADTLTMISNACAQLGQRALVCAGWSDFSQVSHPPHVKVVQALNFAAVFPACRAIVHHGGAGTLAAGMRAGVPQLILAMMADHLMWAAQLKRLKVGSGHHFSATTEKSLVADLRQILAPHYAARAREIATRMTKPAESVTVTADLVEQLARSRRVG